MRGALTVESVTGPPGSVTDLDHDPVRGRPDRGGAARHAAPRRATEQTGRVTTRGVRAAVSPPASPLGPPPRPRSSTRPPSGPDVAGPRGLVALYRRLSGLVAAPSADAQAVTVVMAGELDVLAAVVGPHREGLAAAAPGVGVAEAAALVRADARAGLWPRTLEVAAVAGRALRVPGHGTRVQVVAPVLLGREVPAFVLAEEDPAERDRPDGLAGDDVLLLVAE